MFAIKVSLENSVAVAANTDNPDRAALSTSKEIKKKKKRSCAHLVDDLRQVVQTYVVDGVPATERKKYRETVNALSLCLVNLPRLIFSRLSRSLALETDLERAGTTG